MTEQSTRGLADAVVACTAVSEIDAKAGTLSYRGYDIADLAGRATFEEVVHLLHRGELPTRHQLDGVRAALDEGAAAAAGLGAVTAAVADQPPLSALRTVVSASGPAIGDGGALRLVGLLPAVLGQLLAARRDASDAGSAPSSGVAAALLHRATGAQPDQRATAALDECLVVFADHALNGSTMAARLCAAAGGDAVASVTAALATFSGSLHGSVIVRVAHMLDETRGADVIGDGSDGFPGFGHRRYRREDPRAARLRDLARRLAEQSAPARDDIERALSVEDTMVQRSGNHANPEFFAAVVLRALGVADDALASVLAVARCAGWTAHIAEQQSDNRFIRPDSDYIGERGRRFVAIEQR